jgi:hypothetical protein
MPVRAAVAAIFLLCTVIKGSVGGDEKLAFGWPPQQVPTESGCLTVPQHIKVVYETATIYPLRPICNIKPIIMWNSARQFSCERLIRSNHETIRQSPLAVWEFAQFLRGESGNNGEDAQSCKNRWAFSMIVQPYSQSIFHEGSGWIRRAGYGWRRSLLNHLNAGEQVCSLQIGERPFTDCLNPESCLPKSGCHSPQSEGEEGDYSGRESRDVFMVLVNDAAYPPQKARQGGAIFVGGLVLGYGFPADRARIQASLKAFEYKRHTQIKI